jgi:hypothetical protein
MDMYQKRKMVIYMSKYNIKELKEKINRCKI